MVAAEHQCGGALVKRMEIQRSLEHLWHMVDLHDLHKGHGRW
jgi:hypothetical protein